MTVEVNKHLKVEGSLKEEYLGTHNKTKHRKYFIFYRNNTRRDWKFIESKILPRSLTKLIRGIIILLNDN